MRHAVITFFLLFVQWAFAGVIGGTHDHMGPGMGPVVDHTYLPTPEAGRGGPYIKPSTSVAPVKQPRGAFRTDCGFSHMLHDDPIVWPRQPGKSHLHTFFGNTAVTAYSTATTVATTGNSTCKGGIANRSAYWVPSMIDTTTGRPLKPLDIGVYYKVASGTGFIPAKTTAPPEGLRMLAGNAKAASSQSGAVIRWQCIGTKRTTVDPNTGASYPATYASSSLYGQMIQPCPVGSVLNQMIMFPFCWDGANLDSADHKSHMSYGHPTTGCPATHPVLLPQITFNVHYLATETLPDWRLSSDMYSSELPGGYSSHGDWMNGWAPAVKVVWNHQCNVLGFDCHANLLGDGNTLY